MNNNLKSSINQAIDVIKNSNKLCICSHVEPDGDNIGSTLALGMALMKMNKDVRLLRVDDIPQKYLFLPNIEFIKEHDIDEGIDTFIALDCSDMDRLGIGKKVALKANNVINIDHHISNTNFGHINIVSPKSAATGELIYKLINKIGVNIDKDIATCLYTAISTDTGSFMYSNTTYATHLIAAELLQIGIDMEDININLYQSKSIEKTKLFIDCLNSLELFMDNMIGVISVTQHMLKKNDAKLEDTEGLVSFVRDINSVEVAVLLKEMEYNEIKASLRSKKKIDVSKICTKFNGGGHKKAAGCTIYATIAEAKKLILNEIKNEINIALR
ncbi:phosphoesterase RecJ-like protein [Keratinibaculum paraultunense]|uniref:Phosphoesterase RecJ-like protein n=1 Tax=Keratinibaculum paraultunense TaxID=1278232 RepID=A0A4R3KYT0_9FIRM|nr:bifunctional oligoribonuclease/PAP phosphatase NrnA [Keratinibaculum paraultunense]QQY80695.1 bifunctional oligoribonuclease/PAP phosphatase NrnA [Keratinibaculum paraultunense]TCS89702.1 phosphoesterase RecJ-like protein [Keratinibaculum paraultunense]